MALTAEQFNQIVGDLANNRNYVTLDLRLQGLNGNHAKAIANALKTNTILTKLLLDHNKIDNEGLLALTDALKINTTLREITLDVNHFFLDTAEIETYIQRNINLYHASLTASTSSTTTSNTPSTTTPGISSTQTSSTSTTKTESSTTESIITNQSSSTKTENESTSSHKTETIGSSSSTTMTPSETPTEKVTETTTTSATFSEPANPTTSETSRTTTTEKVTETPTAPATFSEPANPITSERPRTPTTEKISSSEAEHEFSTPTISEAEITETVEGTVTHLSSSSEGTQATTTETSALSETELELSSSTSETPSESVSFTENHFSTGSVSFTEDLPFSSRPAITVTDYSTTVTPPLDKNNNDRGLTGGNSNAALFIGLSIAGLGLLALVLAIYFYKRSQNKSNHDQIKRPSKSLGGKKKKSQILPTVNDSFEYKNPLAGMATIEGWDSTIYATGSNAPTGKPTSSASKNPQAESDKPTIAGWDSTIYATGSNALTGKPVFDSGYCDPARFNQKSVSENSLARRAKQPIGGWDSTMYATGSNTLIGEPILDSGYCDPATLKQESSASKTPQAEGDKSPKETWDPTMYAIGSKGPNQNQDVRITLDSGYCSLEALGLGAKSQGAYNQETTYEQAVRLNPLYQTKEVSGSHHIGESSTDGELSDSANQATGKRNESGKENPYYESVKPNKNTFFIDTSKSQRETTPPIGFSKGLKR